MQQCRRTYFIFEMMVAFFFFFYKIPCTDTSMWRYIRTLRRRGRSRFLEGAINQNVWHLPEDISLVRGQLFEGRLALKPGLNLSLVSFSFVQKYFLR